MSEYEPGDTMIDALRRANPVPSDPAASRRSLPSAHALLADVTAHRPRRVRTRVLIVVIAVVVIALLVMAFMVARRESATIATTPVCYSSDSLTASRIVTSGETPVDACKKIWKDGMFGSRAVPNFDVCVLPSGAAAVFPGESGSVCAGLDLPEASGDDSVERFADAVNRRVSAKCFGLDETERIVRNALSQRKLSDWTVKPGSGFDSGSCATIGVDQKTRTVRIIAVPNPRLPLPPPSS